ncbi:hypothetical protein PENSPDRAFT_694911 [Peniophora sp. CONT]|nr:hypothetical protein PENSPDRAFT_694911 [Peniophora sp. CONT]
MNTSPTAEISPTRPWSEDRLHGFMLQMQLRICAIFRHYKSREIHPEVFPRDSVFIGNLYEELAFTLNVIGHAVLTGTPKPDSRFDLLRTASTFYLHKQTPVWQELRKEAVAFYSSWNVFKHDDPSLPFPQWWHNMPYYPFNLSSWIKDNLADKDHPALVLLESEVKDMLEKVTQLADGVEGQREYTNAILGAASEEIASSGRDWAGVQASLQTRYNTM